MTQTKKQKENLDRDLREFYGFDDGKDIVAIAKRLKEKRGEDIDEETRKAIERIKKKMPEIDEKKAEEFRQAVLDSFDKAFSKDE